METSISNFFGPEFNLFKSYYVVWKLQSYVTTEKEKIEFKSYYVVWKRITILNTSSPKTKFKSYYVVWKPYEVTQANDGRYHRLNRTMQYGNVFLVTFFFSKKVTFKSYYVVWKLFFILLVFILFLLFKSYYVVWKLIYFFRRVIKKKV